MNIHLNGKKIETAAATIDELLAEKKLEGARVAVEQNGMIIYSDAYASAALNEGDSIEIVGFVGGG